MADTCNAATFKLISVTHGSALLSPMEFSFQEAIEFVKQRIADRVSAAVAIQSYDLTATVKLAEWVTPIVRGTRANLVAALKTIGGSTKTVTLSNMQAGQCSGSQGNDGIGSWSQEFQYDPANTESFAPIAVT
jgi:hypothetical protein